MLGIDSRPITPESPLHNSESLDNTIDDLTLALNNFSRVPSPEPPSLFTCCCQQEDCENFRTWQAVKSRLENRLTLSAEIGQALLRRHEAYVRRHENCSVNDSNPSSGDERLSELLKEKHALEKRLTQALVNNEVTEVSSKTLHQELLEAQTMISRLSANHAKSIGWENRLSVVNKEKDDMQQERDFESQRARLAESRFAALKEKTSKLQSEVRRLQNELEEKRILRMESTESLLKDARSRIQMLHASIGGPSTDSENSELTKVLESLVDDNEGLKRDNAELQSLLAESRDDLYALQQEVEEQRANMSMNPPRSRAVTPVLSSFGRSHHYSGSMPSSVIREQVAPLLKRRNSSLERRGLRPPEPLTPDTLSRELPPPHSPVDSEPRSTFSQTHHYAHLSPSSYQIEFDGENDSGPASPEKTRSHRPLFLLTRSRAIQTDPLPTGLLSPSPIPTSPATIPIPTPSPDPRSEASSFSESTASNMAILIERMTALLTRMTQADALTLTNRLKRQHLRGADVGHLSRSTISNIINEISTLRTQFRHLLEDENVVTMCTRKDLRALFKLFREVFVEMGAIRVTLNDIILDPAIAHKVSELALDPSKAEKNKDGSAAGGWMAPISKLFSASAGGRTDAAAGAERTVSPAATALGGLVRSTSGRGNAKPQRFVPKLQPALSASATTVNVEFSSGVGRSVTSSAAPSAGPSRQNSSTTTAHRPTTPSSSSVMGIFAGAPPPPSPDPWVVIPKGPRRVQSSLHGDGDSPVLFRRPGFGLGVNPNVANRMSRNVDAVIDEQNTRSPILHEGEEDREGEGEDVVAPLMQHTLRRRGLSDSSIHSTYMGQVDEEGAVAPSEPAWPTKGSVLDALSRRVQSFKSGITDVLPSYDDRRHPIPIPIPGPGRETLAAPAPAGPTSSSKSKSSSRTVSKSGLSGFIPDLSWGAAAEIQDVGIVDPNYDALMAASSPRDDSPMLRTYRDRDGMSGGW
ncbi:hypothetical protein BT96DRAFT_914824 [Gymnopus androsaceus JB14]|uniref:Uncharacterized protein n=1 Tax=Gymnopus androsaceus JB14 TaxID=1447944 RepID=A0A6A4I5K8_9AGAR|nr:hypothetical protein BT96DRAFT_914824 [Gymnopus androsaceus JB14]